VQVHYQKRHTQGLENTNTSMIFLKRFHLLNSMLFGGGLFMNRTSNKLLLAKRVEQLQYHLASKIRETHNTT
jgi:hypothetical protein